MLLLIVPVLSKTGDAGVNTAGSKESCKSYEIIPCPVTSPIAIGTVIMEPANALTFGSATKIAPPIGVGVEVAVGVNVAVGGTVGVKVAVFVGVGVSVIVFVGVDVFVAAGVGEATVMLPLTAITAGSPSL